MHVLELVYNYARSVRSFTRYMLQRDLGLDYGTARNVINTLNKTGRLVEIVQYVYTFRDLVDMEDRGACMIIYSRFRDYLMEQLRKSRGELIRICFRAVAMRLDGVFEFRSRSGNKKGKIYAVVKSIFEKACREAGLGEEDYVIYIRKPKSSLGYIKRDKVDLFLQGLRRVLKLEKTCAEEVRQIEAR